MKIHIGFSLLLAATLFILLFVGGPDDTASRSISSFWNLGHIVLFFIITHLLLTAPSPLSPRPFITQCLAVMLFTLILGGLVELFQWGIGRTMDSTDLMRNFIGSSLRLFLPGINRPQLAQRPYQLLQGLSLLAVAMALLPLATAVLDEQRAIKQWPVLAEFEHSLELQRWSANGNAALSMDRKIFFSGEQALRVQLGTAEYSGINFEYFPADWSTYTQLVLNIHNPEPQALTVTCRIHDRQHNQQFNDRFNQSYQLHQGWNRISINLDNVANAPFSRRVDLTEVGGLGIFVSNQARPRVITVDTIYLSKQ